MHQSHILQYTIFLQKCAHVCTFLLQKGCIVGYLSDALWDLWDVSIDAVATAKQNTAKPKVILVKHNVHRAPWPLKLYPILYDVQALE